MPYGKNRIRLEQVPETLFFATDGTRKFTDSVEVDDDGIIRPLLGRKVSGKWIISTIISYFGISIHKITF